jgi:hypothetical protein
MRGWIRWLRLRLRVRVKESCEETSMEVEVERNEEDCFPEGRDLCGMND